MPEQAGSFSRVRPEIVSSAAGSSGGGCDDRPPASLLARDKNNSSTAAMPSTPHALVMSAAVESRTAEVAPTAMRRWRPAVESVAIPVGAVVAAMVLFGIFCEFQGRNAFKVYAAIYKAAFGSWYSFQNTLLRASPLMLTALCTALPARLGMIVIGNEGALVVGGVAATAAGLAVQSAPLLVVIGVMLAGGMIGGGL